MNIVHATRQTRRDARRERILDAAMSLVISEGIATFTIHRLAANLGYAPGALYRYFPSKDALLAELQRRALTRLGEALDGACEKARARAAARDLAERETSLLVLLAAGEVYENLSKSSPETFHLLGMLLGDPREILNTDEAKTVVDAALPLLESIAGLFREAARAGALEAGNAMDRAVLYWAAMQGLMQLQKLSRVAPKQIDAFRLAPRLRHALLRGFGADLDFLRRKK